MRTNLLAMLFMLLISAAPAAANISNNNPAADKTRNLTDEQKARIEALTNRVKEIKSLDKSKLTKAERKELRSELKDINKEAKAIQGRGIYISLGALILIALLVILL